MIWQTIHHKVRKSFSDAALNYEVLSSLHKEIARELIRKVMHVDAQKVLDVGTGTGYLANKAKFYFPDALVIGLDLADGMVLEANKLKEGIHIVQADACALSFKPETFDLIVSNLAYQWVSDLPLAFSQAYRCLNSQGELCLTLFGYQTLNELFTTIEAVGLSRQPQRRLVNKDEVGLALRLAGLKEFHVDYELIRVEFQDVMELLKWIKNIGANILNDEIFLGPRKIATMDQYYKAHFPYYNGICVTFEVIWVLAKK